MTMSTIRFLTRVGRNPLYAYAYGQHQSHRQLCYHLLHMRTLAAANAAQTQIFCVKFSPIISCYRYGFSTKNCPDRAGKSDTKASPALAETDIFGEASKLGLFAKFKLMYKKYWYVLIPVHVVTSIGWFGGFYYMSKSGVDIPSLLQYMRLSESIIDKVQNSSMGHVAIAYLCYKVATPLRYAVTLGGTTVSIKYLVQAGHIKPMPSKQELMQMYEQKKADRAAAKEEAAAAESDEKVRKNERDK